VTVSAFLKMGTVTQAPVLAFACSNTGLRPVCIQLVLVCDLGTCFEWPAMLLHSSCTQPIKRHWLVASSSFVRYTGTATYNIVWSCAGPLQLR
jgi:hypothetical protein